MKYLLDTGILLRLVHRTDPLHTSVRDAVARLNARGDTLNCGMQNIAEFWNVTTRPLSARGGFGLTPAEAEQGVVRIERNVTVLTDSPASYVEWKRLIVLHSVSGVQVHDTKLVALMNTNGIQHLLTLNPVDFRRFSGLVVVTPNDVLSGIP